MAGMMAGLVIAMVVLLVLQIRSSTQVNKLTFPAYEYVVKQASHKADEILHAAQKEAQSIVSEAEKSGQKIVQEYTTSATEVHTAYLKTVEQFTHNHSDALAVAAQEGALHLEKLVASVTESVHAQEEGVRVRFDESLQAVEKMSQRIEGRTNESVSKMEELLTQVGTALETRTSGSIEKMENHVSVVEKTLIEKLQNADQQQQEYIHSHLEKALEAAEKHIIEYQKSRIGLLDMHIEKLVEDVTKRVLNKELTVQDHAQLARQALTEAKEHNLI